MSFYFIREPNRWSHPDLLQRGEAEVTRPWSRANRSPWVSSTLLAPPPTFRITGIANDWRSRALFKRDCPSVLRGDEDYDDDYDDARMRWTKRTKRTRTRRHATSPSVSSTMPIKASPSETNELSKNVHGNDPGYPRLLWLMRPLASFIENYPHRAFYHRAWTTLKNTKTRKYLTFDRNDSHVSRN